MADFKNLILGIPFCPGAAPGFSNFVLNAVNDKLHIVFQCPEAATITTVGFRYGARVGTPVQHQVSLQGVSTTTGAGDGTILSAGNAKATFTPPADGTWDATWRELALTASYACARGEFLAMVIEPLGTPDGSNNSSFTYTAENLGGQVTQGIAVREDGGVLQGKVTIPAPFSFKSASKTYGFPALSYTTLDLSLTTTPDEVGLLFTLSSDWVSTFTIDRVYAGLQRPYNSQSYKIQLYDGTTVLQDITLDSDFMSANAGYRCHYFDESSLATLNGGTPYRLTFAPQVAGTDFNLFYLNVNSSTDLEPWAGAGSFLWTERTNLGAFSEINTRIPFMQFGIKDWTVPGGGGGGIVQPVGGGLVNV